MLRNFEVSVVAVASLLLFEFQGNKFVQLPKHVIVNMTRQMRIHTKSHSKLPIILNFPSPHCPVLRKHIVGYRIEEPLIPKMTRR